MNKDLKSKTKAQALTSIKPLIIGFMATIMVMAAFALFAQAYAGQPKQLGSYKKWTAYTMTDGQGRVCYMFSNPIDTSPRNVRRGDIYFLVTHRPSSSVVNEISVQTGYTYKNSSTVKATIGKKAFNMFTKADGAWLETAAEEKKMVKTMRGGSVMRISGYSTKGTNTKDKYSLAGFTAAYNAISRACKVK
jgi:hypothetical protein